MSQQRRDVSGHRRAARHRAVSSRCPQGSLSAWRDGDHQNGRSRGSTDSVSWIHSELDDVAGRGHGALQFADLLSKGVLNTRCGGLHWIVGTLDIGLDFSSSPQPCGGDVASLGPPPLTVAIGGSQIPADARTRSGAELTPAERSPRSRSSDSCGGGPAGAEAVALLARRRTRAEVLHRFVQIVGFAAEGDGVHCRFTARGVGDDVGGIRGSRVRSAGCPLQKAQRPSSPSQTAREPLRNVARACSHGTADAWRIRCWPASFAGDARVDVVSARSRSRLAESLAGDGVPPESLRAAQLLDCLAAHRDLHPVARRARGARRRRGRTAGREAVLRESVRTGRSIRPGCLLVPAASSGGCGVDDDGDGSFRTYAGAGG